jgi:hypothetical protein
VPVPVFVPGVVFLLIAVRGLSRVRLPIWPVMLGGAAYRVHCRQYGRGHPAHSRRRERRDHHPEHRELKIGHTIGFLEFARIGIPLTIVNVLVYWLFLRAW